MMTAQQLKNSILQRAIEGKLVEQRPEEGTAKELLKEIKLEKEKLVKEGKIKKSKPLPPITEDEIPFDVPESWEWVRLIDVTNVIGDGIHGTPSYDNNGTVYFVNGNNLCDGKIVIKPDTKRVSKSEAEKHFVTLDETSFLVSINGTIGNTAFYNNEPIILGKSACYFNLLGKIDKKYIKLIVGSDYYLKYALSEATGTTIKNVSLKSMRKFPIPLPPLSEQHRIVAKIEELLPLVDKYDKAYSQLTALNEKFPQDMKKSILQYAIEGKLVEQRPEEGTAKELLKEIKLEKEKLVKEGKIKKNKPLPAITEDEIPFEIPDSWVWVRWGDLSQSIQYGYNASAQPSGRIKMVRISDIQDNEVLWDTVPYCSIEDKDIETYLLQPDDILFARTGGTVGKSYLVDKVPEEAIYAGYLIRTRYSKLLVPRYLKTFMESALYWEQLKNGTIATAQPNCNGKTLSKMLIPLPPLSEQHRIVEKIDQLLSLCDRLAI